MKAHATTCWQVVAVQVGAPGANVCELSLRYSIVHGEIKVK